MEQDGVVFAHINGVKYEMNGSEDPRSQAYQLAETLRKAVAGEDKRPLMSLRVVIEG